ncbi:MAG: ester cyclase [bacterium]
MKQVYYLILSIAICLSSVFLQSCVKNNNDEIRELAMKFEQAMQNQDLDALLELYADDATMIIAGEAEPLKGKEAIRANQGAYFRAFPDMKIEFAAILTSEDEFCIEWILQGTNTGPLSSPEGEIPPTGRAVNLQGAFFGKVSPEGLVTEDRTYFDSAVMMAQLGLNNQPNKETVFRALHLITIESEDDEAAFIALLNDFNKVVAELGYPGIKYQLWKERGDRQGKYKYFFESTWPDQETYDKVHEHEKYKAVLEKAESKYDELVKDDIYSRYVLVN